MPDRPRDEHDFERTAFYVDEPLGVTIAAAPDGGGFHLLNECRWVAEGTGGADPGSPAIRYEAERPSARASSPFTMDWQFTRPGVAASRRRHGIAVQQYLSSR